MMRKAPVLLAVLLVWGVAVAHAALFTGFGLSSSSPVPVSPPTLVAGAGWSGPTAVPAQQGSPGNTGYTTDAIAVWDYQETPSGAMLASAATICINAQAVSGVKSVQMAIDGGSFATATLWPTTVSNGYVSSYSEYCAKVDPTLVSDGRHEIRAIVTPNAGYPRVLQSGATVSLVSGAEQISAGPHGIVNGAVLVAGTTAGGFTKGVTYVATNILDGRGYALSPTSQLNNSNNRTYTPNAATVTSSTITQSNAYANGQAVVLTSNYNSGQAFSQPVGLTIGTVYYVCGASVSAYSLASTAANAIAATCNVTWTGSPSGITTVWPVATPNATASLDLYHANAGAREWVGSLSGSLFLNTNNGGTINVYNQYVSTSGNDSCSGRAGSFGSPCATMSRAIANLSVSNTAAYTVVGGCATFTRIAHGLVSGDLVDFTAGVFDGTSFAAALPPQMLSANAETYYVIGTNYTPDRFSVAKTPGGACIGDNTTAPTGVTFTSDLSHSNIYLMCPGGCVTPAGYALGGVTENTQRQAAIGFVNVLPYAGLTHANVLVDSVGCNATTCGTNGLRVDKLHIAVDVGVKTFTLTTDTDSPINGGILSTDAVVNASGVVKNAIIQSSTNNCARDGTTSSNIMIGNSVTGVTSAAGVSTIALTTGNQADCPIGTTVTLSTNWSIGQGYDLWVDSASIVGSGTWTNTFLAGTGTTWFNRIFATNMNVSNDSHGLHHVTYSWNSRIHDTDGSFNNNKAVISSTQENVGLQYQYITLQVPAGWSSGVSSIVVNPFPAQMRDGWIIVTGGGSGTTTGIQASTSITAYNASTKTITLSLPTNAIAAGAATIVMTTNVHPDVAFNQGTYDNNIVANLNASNNAMGEAWFEQNGPFMDMALVDSNLYLVDHSGAIWFDLLLESPLAGMYVARNNFLNPSSTVSLRANLALSPSDVYFIGNACTEIGAVTTAATGQGYLGSSMFVIPSQGSGGSC